MTRASIYFDSHKFEDYFLHINFHLKMTLNVGSVHSNIMHEAGCKWKYVGIVWKSKLWIF